MRTHRHSARTSIAESSKHIAFRRLRDADGNATVEFPLVSALVITLALSIMQLALYVHVRNGLTDAAVQAAHYAALEGNDLQTAEGRAREIVDRRFASLITPDYLVTEDDGIVRVQIQARMPLIALIGPERGLQVAGHAVKEESL